MTEREIEVSVRTKQVPALQRALAAAKADALDSATVALAQRYTELLDEAVAADKYTKALRLIGQAVEQYSGTITQEQQMADAWDRISSALAEHSVASDLGPKLLAALTALGLTPASRAQKPGGSNVSEMPSALAKLRSADKPWSTQAS